MVSAPFCYAKEERGGTDIEETRRRKNLECHHGFTCYNPQHTHVTLARFQRRLAAMADQTALPNEIRNHTAGLCAQFVDALGLDRDATQVPQVTVPPFSMETIAALDLPPRQAPGGGTCYSVPANYDEQYRRIKLRELRACPFGLDCRDPERAVSLVWQLFSIMRYQVEPLLATEDNCEWAWDRQLYQALGGTLELMGMDAAGQEIQKVVDSQRDKYQPLAFWPAPAY